MPKPFSFVTNSQKVPKGLESLWGSSYELFFMLTFYFASSFHLSVFNSYLNYKCDRLREIFKAFNLIFCFSHICFGERDCPFYSVGNTVSLGILAWRMSPSAERYRDMYYLLYTHRPWKSVTVWETVRYEPQILSN